jgi:hypothetical protein
MEQKRKKVQVLVPEQLVTGNHSAAMPAVKEDVNDLIHKEYAPEPEPADTSKNITFVGLGAHLLKLKSGRKLAITFRGPHYRYMTGNAEIIEILTEKGFKVLDKKRAE